MENEAVKEKKSIFTERKRMTLGMKLVCTFAMTYYMLLLIVWTYFVFNYSVVAEDNINGPLSDFVKEHHYLLFMVEWVLLAAIVTSLFLVFFKKRVGKFLFMVFSLLLIGCQFFTTYPPAWLTYILELLIVLIIAPLRVISKFTDIIQTETQKLNPFKEEK